MTTADDSTGSEQPLRPLYQKALQAASAVRSALELPPTDMAGERDETAIEQYVDEALNTVRDHIDSALELGADDADAAAIPGSLGVLAFRLALARHEIVAETLERRLSGLSAVQVALGRLRAIRSSTEMMARAPKILAEHCGFSMAALARAGDGGRVIPVSAYHVDDPDWESKYMEALTNQHEILLNSGALEAEMMRRRTAVIVWDAYHDTRTEEAWEPLRASGTTAYVAAPVMPEGRVIGFLHATRRGTVDLVDRDVLWTFAEGYGYALERSILLERLHQHGTRIQGLLRETDAALEELREADLQIAGLDAKESEYVQAPRTAVFAGPTSPVHDLLTRREIEIIELIAHGDTNRQIADRLIISEGTAKAHVSQILRKMKAANRAEAVSNYSRLLKSG